MTQMSSTDMRDAFFGELHGVASRDRDLVVLSNDFGAPSLDRFRADLPQQFINAAISEQNMMSAAAGMAMAGKRVVVYSIATFATLRALEQVKIDICAMHQPVTILAVGTGYAYSTDGPTHHATEDIAVMRALKGMSILSPSEPRMVADFARRIADVAGPTYVRLDRGRMPVLDHPETGLPASGLRVFGDGRDVALIATGGMLHRALDVSRALAARGIAARVVDLVRLKPLDTDAIGEALRPVATVATVEEHSLHGGLGGIVAETLADLELLKPLKRFGIPDDLLYAYGERDALHAGRGLDVIALSRSLEDWLARGRS